MSSGWAPRPLDTGPLPSCVPRVRAVHAPGSSSSGSLSPTVLIVVAETAIPPTVRTMTSHLTRSIAVLALASASFMTSPVAAHAATPAGALDKALVVTQKAVLASTSVRVDGNDAGTKRTSTTSIVDQTHYSLLSGKRLTVQLGKMSYEGIDRTFYSNDDLAALLAKYPTAKYVTANVGAIAIGFDAVTYRTGYIIDMAKTGRVTKVTKDKTTTYRFTTAKIIAGETWNEYMGFADQPVSGSIQVDAKGRIVYAYAVTADKTTSLKVSYSYTKQIVRAPKASEGVTQEEFIALVPSLLD